MHFDVEGEEWQDVVEEKYRTEALCQLLLDAKFHQRHAADLGGLDFDGGLVLDMQIRAPLADVLHCKLTKSVIVSFVGLQKQQHEVVGFFDRIGSVSDLSLLKKPHHVPPARVRSENPSTCTYSPDWEVSEILSFVLHDVSYLFRETEATHQIVITCNRH